MWGPFARISVSIGGLRCGTIMVARVRRNFCQYRWAPMWLWSPELTGTSVSIGCGRECTRRLGFQCRTIMVVRIRSNFCQYNIRCLKRRESGEKALLGMVAGGCGRDCSGRLVFVGFCRHGMWNQQALEWGVNIAEDETAVSAPSMLWGEEGRGKGPWMEAQSLWRRNFCRY